MGCIACCPCTMLAAPSCARASARFKGRGSLLRRARISMPRRPFRALVLRLGEAAEVKLAARLRTAPTKHFRGVLALSGGPAVAFVVRMAREDASLAGPHPRGSDPPSDGGISAAVACGCPSILCARFFMMAHRTARTGERQASRAPMRYTHECARMPASRSRLNSS